jgi:hypothetical protein
MYSRRGIPGFVCEKCKRDDAVHLYPGMIKYLENTEQLPLSQALCYKITKESGLILKEILAGVVEICIETPLQSTGQQFKEYV